jgi:hypothetical protein
MIPAPYTDCWVEPRTTGELRCRLTVLPRQWLLSLSEKMLLFLYTYTYLEMVGMSYDPWALYWLLGRAKDNRSAALPLDSASWPMAALMIWNSKQTNVKDVDLLGRAKDNRRAAHPDHGASVSSFSRSLRWLRVGLRKWLSTNALDGELRCYLTVLPDQWLPSLSEIQSRSGFCGPALTANGSLEIKQEI